MGVLKKIKKICRFLAKEKLTKEDANSILQKLNLITVGDKSIISGSTINIRNRSLSKVFFSVGEESVVSGNYIFENENGYVEIGNRSFIGGGGKFISIEKISIGNDVLISWGCTIMDNNAHSVKWSERKDDVREWKRGIDENKIGYYKNWTYVKSGPVIIEDKAWIGFEVVVLKGVKIGKGAIVASRSVVTKDVPDWTIVAGNPAQVVREIPESER
jgi:acetyltransferase-like isoleucine patch superfamily enzyme